MRLLFDIFDMERSSLQTANTSASTLFGILEGAFSLTFWTESVALLCRQSRGVSDPPHDVYGGQSKSCYVARRKRDVLADSECLK